MRRLTMQGLLLCAMAVTSASVSAGPTALPSVTTSAAAVTVKVTPRTFDGGTWDFDVVFDTHSQELMDDLLKTAVLVAVDGSELAPFEWKGAAPGGHHRAGLLRFKAPNPVPSPVVLRITRPGEPKPRVFQWKVQ